MLEPPQLRGQSSGTWAGFLRVDFYNISGLNAADKLSRAGCRTIRFAGCCLSKLCIYVLFCFRVLIDAADFKASESRQVYYTAEVALHPWPPGQAAKPRPARGTARFLYACEVKYIYIYRDRCRWKILCIAHIYGCVCVWIYMYKLWLTIFVITCVSISGLYTCVLTYLWKSCIWTFLHVCASLCVLGTLTVYVYIYMHNIYIYIYIHIHIYTYTYTSTYHVYIYIYTYTRITCVMISIYIHTLIHLPIKFVFLLTILLRRMDIPASNLIQSCSFPEILHYIDSIGIYPV